MGVAIFVFTLRSSRTAIKKEKAFDLLFFFYFNYLIA